jgi:hypothetical protein
VFSSVRELSLYAAALVNGGANEHGRVLEAATLERMWEPQLELAPDATAMGLAFFLHRFGAHRVVGHDGGWPGFISAFLVAPDDGVAAIVFTNTSAGGPTVRVSTEAMRMLLGAPELELPRADVPQRTDLWPELTGLYRPARGLNTNLRAWQLLGGEAEVLVREGHLTLRALSPLPPLRKGLRLHAVDPGDPLRFVVSHAGVSVPVVFERDERGAVVSVATGTRFGFLRLHRATRLRSVRLWGQAAGAAAGAAAAVTLTRRARSK